MLLRLLMGLFFLLWGPMGLLGQDCVPEAPGLQRSQMAYDKGQYLKAIRHLDKLLKAAPTCAVAYHWKGRCLTAIEEYALAYEAHTLACELAPETATYWLARGDFKRLLGSLRLQQPTACGDCGKQWVPDITDAAPPARYWESAVLDYKKALQLAPNAAPAHYALALTYQALGQPQKACPHMAQAAELGHAEAPTYLDQHCSDKE